MIQIKHIRGALVFLMFVLCTPFAASATTMVSSEGCVLVRTWDRVDTRYTDEQGNRIVPQERTVHITIEDCGEGVTTRTATRFAWHSRILSR